MKIPLKQKAIIRTVEGACGQFIEKEILQPLKP